MLYIIKESPGIVASAQTFRLRGRGRRGAEGGSAHPTQAAKTVLGLDQHQNRRWTFWHRWTTLAILAHAFLAVAPAHCDRAGPTELIPLTTNELRHLFNVLIIEPTCATPTRCSGRSGDADTKPEQ